MKKKRPDHLRLIRGGGKAPPAIELEIDDLTPAGIREAFVVRFGPECAAWLVRRFHPTIRRYGCFATFLPAGGEEPPWFQIAIAFLKKRARKWSVVVRTRSGEKQYRVIWTGGSRGPRELPTAIRRF